MPVSREYYEAVRAAALEEMRREEEAVRLHPIPPSPEELAARRLAYQKRQAAEQAAAVEEAQLQQAAAAEQARMLAPLPPVIPAEPSPYPDPAPAVPPRPHPTPEQLAEFAFNRSQQAQYQAMQQRLMQREAADAEHVRTPVQEMMRTAIADQKDAILAEHLARAAAEEQDRRRSMERASLLQHKEAVAAEQAERESGALLGRAGGRMLLDAGAELLPWEREVDGRWKWQLPAFLSKEALWPELSPETEHLTRYRTEGGNLIPNPLALGRMGPLRHASEWLLGAPARAAHQLVPESWKPEFARADVENALSQEEAELIAGVPLPDYGDLGKTKRGRQLLAWFSPHKWNVREWNRTFGQRFYGDGSEAVPFFPEDLDPEKMNAGEELYLWTSLPNNEADQQEYERLRNKALNERDERGQSTLTKKEKALLKAYTWKSSITDPGGAQGVMGGNVLGPRSLEDFVDAGLFAGGGAGFKAWRAARRAKWKRPGFKEELKRDWQATKDRLADPIQTPRQIAEAGRKGIDLAKQVGGAAADATKRAGQKIRQGASELPAAAIEAAKRAGQNLAQSEIPQAGLQASKDLIQTGKDTAAAARDLGGEVATAVRETAPVLAKDVDDALRTYYPNAYARLREHLGAIVYGVKSSLPTSVTIKDSLRESFPEIDRVVNDIKDALATHRAAKSIPQFSGRGRHLSQPPPIPTRPGSDVKPIDISEVEDPALRASLEAEAAARRQPSIPEPPPTPSPTSGPVAPPSLWQRFQSWLKDQRKRQETTTPPPPTSGGMQSPEEMRQRTAKYRQSDAGRKETLEKYSQKYRTEREAREKAQAERKKGEAAERPPLVVTRHPALVDYLKEQGLIGDDAEVLAHVTAEQVRGRDVIGVLPTALAAQAKSLTEIPMRIPPELRGKELDLPTVRKLAGKPKKFFVSDQSPQTTPAPIPTAAEKSPQPRPQTDQEIIDWLNLTRQRTAERLKKERGKRKEAESESREIAADKEFEKMFKVPPTELVPGDSSDYTTIQGHLRDLKDRLAGRLSYYETMRQKFPANTGGFIGDFDKKRMNAWRSRIRAIEKELKRRGEEPELSAEEITAKDLEAKGWPKKKAQEIAKISQHRQIKRHDGGRVIWTDREKGLSKYLNFIQSQQDADKYGVDKNKVLEGSEGHKALIELVRQAEKAADEFVDPPQPPAKPPSIQDKFNDLTMRRKEILNDQFRRFFDMPKETIDDVKKLIGALEQELRHADADYEKATTDGAKKNIDHQRTWLRKHIEDAFLYAKLQLGENLRPPRKPAALRRPSKTAKPTEADWPAAGATTGRPPMKEMPRREDYENLGEYLSDVADATPETWMRAKDIVAKPSKFQVRKNVDERGVSEDRRIRKEDPISEHDLGTLMVHRAAPTAENPNPKATVFEGHHRLNKIMETDPNMLVRVKVFDGRNITEEEALLMGMISNARQVGNLRDIDAAFAIKRYPQIRFALSRMKQPQIREGLAQLSDDLLNLILRNENDKKRGRLSTAHASIIGHMINKDSVLWPQKREYSDAEKDAEIKRIQEKAFNDFSAIPSVERSLEKLQNIIRFKHLGSLVFSDLPDLFGGATFDNKKMQLIADLFTAVERHMKNIKGTFVTESGDIKVIESAGDAKINQASQIAARDKQMEEYRKFIRISSGAKSGLASPLLKDAQRLVLEYVNKDSPGNRKAERQAEWNEVVRKFLQIIENYDEDALPVAPSLAPPKKPTPATPTAEASKPTPKTPAKPKKPARSEVYQNILNDVEQSKMGETVELTETFKSKKTKRGYELFYRPSRGKKYKPAGIYNSAEEVTNQIEEFYRALRQGEERVSAEERKESSPPETTPKTLEEPNLEERRAAGDIKSRLTKAGVNEQHADQIQDLIKQLSQSESEEARQEIFRIYQRYENGSDQRIAISDEYQRSEQSIATPQPASKPPSAEPNKVQTGSKAAKSLDNISARAQEDFRDLAEKERRAKKLQTGEADKEFKDPLPVIVSGQGKDRAVENIDQIVRGELKRYYSMTPSEEDAAREKIAKAVQAGQTSVVLDLGKESGVVKFNLQTKDYFEAIQNAEVANTITLKLLKGQPYTTKKQSKDIKAWLTDQQGLIGMRTGPETPEVTSVGDKIKKAFEAGQTSLLIPSRDFQQVLRINLPKKPTSQETTAKEMHKAGWTKKKAQEIADIFHRPVHSRKEAHAKNWDLRNIYRSNVLEEENLKRLRFVRKADAHKRENAPWSLPPNTFAKGSNADKALKDIIIQAAKEERDWARKERGIKKADQLAKDMFAKLPQKQGASIPPPIPVKPKTPAATESPHYQQASPERKAEIQHKYHQLLWNIPEDNLKSLRNLQNKIAGLQGKLAGKSGTTADALEKARISQEQEFLIGWFEKAKKKYKAMQKNRQALNELDEIVKKIDSHKGTVEEKVELLDEALAMLDALPPFVKAANWDADDLIKAEDVHSQLSRLDDDENKRSRAQLSRLDDDEDKRGRVGAKQEQEDAAAKEDAIVLKKLIQRGIDEDTAKKMAAILPDKWEKIAYQPVSKFGTGTPNFPKLDNLWELFSKQPGGITAHPKAFEVYTEIMFGRRRPSNAETSKYDSIPVRLPFIDAKWVRNLERFGATGMREREWLNRARSKSGRVILKMDEKGMKLPAEVRRQGECRHVPFMKTFVDVDPQQEGMFAFLESSAAGNPWIGKRGGDVTLPRGTNIIWRNEYGEYAVGRVTEVGEQDTHDWGKTSNIEWYRTPEWQFGAGNLFNNIQQTVKNTMLQREPKAELEKQINLWEKEYETTKSKTESGAAEQERESSLHYISEQAFKMLNSEIAKQHLDDNARARLSKLAAEEAERDRKRTAKKEAKIMYREPVDEGSPIHYTGEGRLWIDGPEDTPEQIRAKIKRVEKELPKLAPSTESNARIELIGGLHRKLNVEHLIPAIQKQITYSKKGDVKSIRGLLRAWIPPGVRYQPHFGTDQERRPQTAGLKGDSIVIEAGLDLFVKPPASEEVDVGWKRVKTPTMKEFKEKNLQADDDIRRAEEAEKKLAALKEKEEAAAINFDGPEDTAEQIRAKIKLVDEAMQKREKSGAVETAEEEFYRSVDKDWKPGERMPNFAYRDVEDTDAWKNLQKERKATEGLSERRTKLYRKLVYEHLLPPIKKQITYRRAAIDGRRLIRLIVSIPPNVHYHPNYDMRGTEWGRWKHSGDEGAEFSITAGEHIAIRFPDLPEYDEAEIKTPTLKELAQQKTKTTDDEPPAAKEPPSEPEPKEIEKAERISEAEPTQSAIAQSLESIAREIALVTRLDELDIETREKQSKAGKRWQLGEKTEFDAGYDDGYWGDLIEKIEKIRDDKRATPAEKNLATGLIEKVEREQRASIPESADDDGIIEEIIGDKNISGRLQYYVENSAASKYEELDTRDYNRISENIRIAKELLSKEKGKINAEDYEVLEKFLEEQERNIEARRMDPVKARQREQYLENALAERKAKREKEAEKKEAERKEAEKKEAEAKAFAEKKEILDFAQDRTRGEQTVQERKQKANNIQKWKAELSLTDAEKKGLENEYWRLIIRDRFRFHNKPEGTPEEMLAKIKAIEKADEKSFGYEQREALIREANRIRDKLRQAEDEKRKAANPQTTEAAKKQRADEQARVQKEPVKAEPPPPTAPEPSPRAEGAPEFLEFNAARNNQQAEKTFIKWFSDRLARLHYDYGKDLNVQTAPAPLFKAAAQKLKQAMEEGKESVEFKSPDGKESFTVRILQPASKASPKELERRAYEILWQPEKMKGQIERKMEKIRRLRESLQKTGNKANIPIANRLAEEWYRLKVIKDYNLHRTERTEKDREAKLDLILESIRDAQARKRENPDSKKFNVIVDGIIRALSKEMERIRKNQPSLRDSIERGAAVKKHRAIAANPRGTRQGRQILYPKETLMPLLAGLDLDEEYKKTGKFPRLRDETLEKHIVDPSRRYHFETAINKPYTTYSDDVGRTEVNKAIQRLRQLLKEAERKQKPSGESVPGWIYYWKQEGKSAEDAAQTLLHTIKRHAKNLPFSPDVLDNTPRLLVAVQDIIKKWDEEGRKASIKYSDKDMNEWSEALKEYQAVMDVYSDFPAEAKAYQGAIKFLQKIQATYEPKKSNKPPPGREEQPLSPEDLKYFKGQLIHYSTPMDSPRKVISEEDLQVIDDWVVEHAKNPHITTPASLIASKMNERTEWVRDSINQALRAGFSSVLFHNNGKFYKVQIPDAVVKEQKAKRDAKAARAAENLAAKTKQVLAFAQDKNQKESTPRQRKAKITRIYKAIANLPKQGADPQADPLWKAFWRIQIQDAKDYDKRPLSDRPEESVHQRNLKIDAAHAVQGMVQNEYDRLPEKEKSEFAAKQTQRVKEAYQNEIDRLTADNKLAQEKTRSPKEETEPVEKTAEPTLDDESRQKQRSANLATINKLVPPKRRAEAKRAFAKIYDPNVRDKQGIIHGLSNLVLAAEKDLIETQARHDALEKEEIETQARYDALEEGDIETQARYDALEEGDIETQARHDAIEEGEDARIPIAFEIDDLKKEKRFYEQAINKIRETQTFEEKHKNLLDMQKRLTGPRDHNAIHLLNEIKRAIYAAKKEQAKKEQERKSPANTSHEDLTNDEIKWLQKLMEEIKQAYPGAQEFVKQNQRQDPRQIAPLPIGGIRGSHYAYVEGIPLLSTAPRLSSSRRGRQLPRLLPTRIG